MEEKKLLKDKDRYALKISDPDFENYIKELASEDMRSVGAEIAWIIRKEYLTRHPKDIFQLNGGVYPCAEEK